MLRCKCGARYNPAGGNGSVVQERAAPRGLHFPPGKVRGGIGCDLNLLPPSWCPGDSHGPVPLFLPAPACPPPAGRAGRSPWVAKPPLGCAGVGHAALRGGHLRGPHPAVAHLPPREAQRRPCAPLTPCPPVFGGGGNPTPSRGQREPGRATQPTRKAAKCRRVLGGMARKNMTQ